MKTTEPADYQHVLRPVAAMPADYPAGLCIPRHRHARGQLLLASGGVIEIRVGEHVWVVPNGRAVWIPAGVEHSVYVISAVAIYSLYIESGVNTGLRECCQVLAVSELLYALISAAMDIPLEYDPLGRDGQVMALILEELKSMAFLPLHAPMPDDGRLRIICQAITDDPGCNDTLAQWGLRVGATSRTLANHFRRETGLTFGRWRQQARLVAAVRQLAVGQAVSVVARDLGYASESAFIAMFRRALGITPARYFDRS